MSEPLILDNTKRGTFCGCKQKYFLFCVKGVQSNRGSTAIRYGVGYHGMQEGYHEWVKENGWPSNATDKMAAISQALVLGKKKWDKESIYKETVNGEELTKAIEFFDDYKNYNTLVDAFNAYLEEFARDQEYITILDTESIFECPIEPENLVEEKLLKKLPPIVFTGRIDLTVEMDGLVWLEDFKTTGWILDQVIAKTNRSPQFIGYSYAGKKCTPYEPSGVLGSFHQVGAYKSKKTGEYGSAKFDFRRVPQVYTAKDIAAWKLSFIDTCKGIVECMQTGIWPQSFDNCHQYGQCQYLRLCNQHCEYDELNLDGFHIDLWDVRDED